MSNVDVNIKFSIHIKAYSFTSYKELNNTSSYKDLDKEDIELEIDKFIAANFLYRFAPTIFNIDHYKFALKFNKYNIIDRIIFIDTNNDHVIFLVANFQDVLEQINEGYIRIRTLEKISSLLEFDFEDSRKEDENGYIDEFDLEPQPIREENYNDILDEFKSPEDE